MSVLCGRLHKPCGNFDVEAVTCNWAFGKELDGTLASQAQSVLIGNAVAASQRYKHHVTMLLGC